MKDIQKLTRKLHFVVESGDFRKLSTLKRTHKLITKILSLRKRK